MPQSSAKDTDPGVLIIGSINMDMVVRVEHMPRPGETITGQAFDTMPGGKGANQAVAAARLGGASTLIGRIGDDAFGKELIGHLADQGVNTQYIQATSGCPSGVAAIWVDRMGENAITVVPGANGAVSPGDLESLEPIIAAARVVVLQLEIPIPTVCAAARLAGRHGVWTILDPAPAPGSALPNELVGVDILTPNESEAESLTGVAITGADQAERAGRVLIGQGARCVVLTLGSRGAMIVERDGRAVMVPAHEVDVVDSTAAGDAFTGAMAVAMAEGAGMEDAVKMGCAAGSLACTRPGAQWAMPDRAAVAAILG
ncbi:MAG: ribokinase [Planctomycetaceae bacterium]|nr:ribokinase [Planctomycetaceae bacterium]